MKKPDRNVAEFDETVPHVPWVVRYGRMVISRHGAQADAERVASKLNQLLDRRSPARMVLDVLRREGLG